MTTLDSPTLRDSLSHVVIGHFPHNELSEATANKATSLPMLLDFIDNAIGNLDTLEENYIGHIYALNLLSEWKEAAAIDSLVRLARLPEEILASLLGDDVTDNLHRFMASICFSDSQVLNALIEDASVNEWSRLAAMQALVILTKEGVLSNEQFEAYLATLFSMFLRANDATGMTCLLAVCCDANPKKHELIIRKIFATALIIEDDVITLPEYEELLTHFDEQADEDIAYYSLIKNAVAEVKEWPCFDSLKATPKTAPSERHTHDHQHSHQHTHGDCGCDTPSKPVTRLQPKVGRNDPCLCGSGKKYKKCCLQ